MDAGTMLVQETTAASAALPAQPTSHLLEYLNQVEEMFMVKETADISGPTTKAELFEELQRLGIERDLSQQHGLAVQGGGHCRHQGRLQLHHLFLFLAPSRQSTRRDKKRLSKFTRFEDNISVSIK